MRRCKPAHLQRFLQWSQPGSNRRPPACKAGALPTELWPRRRSSVPPVSGWIAALTRGQGAHNGFAHPRRYIRAVADTARCPELTELETFVLAVEEGSIARAAARLRISSPAAAKRIRQLETLAHAPLLSRGRRGVTPTDAGNRLYPIARELVFRRGEAVAALRGAQPIDPIHLAGLDEKSRASRLPPLGLAAANGELSKRYLQALREGKPSVALAVADEALETGRRDRRDPQSHDRSRDEDDRRAVGAQRDLSRGRTPRDRDQPASRRPSVLASAQRPAATTRAGSDGGRPGRGARARTPSRRGCARESPASTFSTLAPTSRCAPCSRPAGPTGPTSSG